MVIQMMAHVHKSMSLQSTMPGLALPLAHNAAFLMEGPTVAACSQNYAQCPSISIYMFKENLQPCTLRDL